MRKIVAIEYDDSTPCPSYPVDSHESAHQEFIDGREGMFEVLEILRTDEVWITRGMRTCRSILGGIIVYEDCLETWKENDSQ